MKNNTQNNVSEIPEPQKHPKDSKKEVVFKQKENDKPTLNVSFGDLLKMKLKKSG